MVPTSVLLRAPINIILPNTANDYSFIRMCDPSKTMWTAAIFVSDFASRVNVLYFKSK